MILLASIMGIAATLKPGSQRFMHNRMFITIVIGYELPSTDVIIPDIQDFDASFFLIN